jgi:hypothetical protein
MSEATTSAAKFGCPSCGRQFTWKPELAGKSAKCKCGATIKVPAQPQASASASAPKPPPPPAPEGNPLDDAYDFAEPTPPPLPKRSQAAAAPAGTGAGCPSCGASMLPGAVICVSCGFNLKTGQKMSTVMGGAAAASAPGRTVAPPGGVAGAFGAPVGPRPVARGAGGDSNVGTIIKLVVIPIVLLGVVAGAIFGFKRLSGPNEAALGPAKGKDREVRQMMKDDGATELKEWLKNGGNRRMVMGMTIQQADGLADRLYNMGAVKVYAFGGVVTASLAVELPQDPDKRRELVDWQTRWHTDMFEPPQKDEGQQYLLIKMKL